MTDVARARRLAGRIQEIVADCLHTQVRDPRLGMVTLTDVRVTPDLREATIFYTVLGDAAERSASAAALDSAKGVLRSQVGRQTGVKFTPSLEFIADHVPDSARQIEDLLERARRADAEVQRAAAGASPAGEADPYRHIEEPDSASAPAASAPEGTA
ncbi:MAG: 30S ribosome-binding factor RbfA [Actinomycetota bacterium]|nr:30S ribosome-binding factor RbfA [Actinomycetota bacterium]